MDPSSLFSPDYATARERFRQAITRLGWQHEAHPLVARGPKGEELTVDVGYSAPDDSQKALVLSSGIHGVEGFFGSAVQLALLERWTMQAGPRVKCVLLHGLNPSGFAMLRRCDENNVDPNRNFLLPGETFVGAPAGYADLDPWLNPRRQPSWWEPFTVKGLWALARYGMPALRQIIAAGQYDFPRGLFYGGSGPSEVHRLLESHLPRWLQGSRAIAHIDFHTGLGQSGSCKLLIDYPLSPRQRSWLTEWFGPDSFEESGARTIAYDTRGSFDRWCVARKLAEDYLFVCAEFGTYGAMHVLAGLSAENQAHHWGAPSAAGTVRARQRLKELFCPAAPTWRRHVLAHCFELVDRAVQGLGGC